jgi:hypothetical protein
MANEYSLAASMCGRARFFVGNVLYTVNYAYLYRSMRTYLDAYNSTDSSTVKVYPRILLNSSSASAEIGSGITVRCLCGRRFVGSLSSAPLTWIPRIISA